MRAIIAAISGDGVSNGRWRRVQSWPHAVMAKAPCRDARREEERKEEVGRKEGSRGKKRRKAGEGAVSHIIRLRARNVELQKISI